MAGNSSYLSLFPDVLSSDESDYKNQADYLTGNFGSWYEVKLTDGGSINCELYTVPLHK